MFSDARVPIIPSGVGCYFVFARLEVNHGADKNTLGFQRKRYRVRFTKLIFMAAYWQAKQVTAAKNQRSSALPGVSLVVVAQHLPLLWKKFRNAKFARVSYF